MKSEREGKSESESDGLEWRGGGGGGQEETRKGNERRSIWAVNRKRCLCVSHPL